MSKRRREWTESLKQGNDLLGKKKKTINILEEETYKVENGDLVLVKSSNPKKNSKDSCNNNRPNFENINQMSPSQLHNNVGVKYLTPTWRNPNKFLTETKKLMDNLSTVSELQQQDNSTEGNNDYEELNESATLHSFSNMSASTAKCVEEDQWITSKTEGSSVDIDRQKIDSNSLNTIDDTPESHNFQNNTSFNTISKHTELSPKIKNSDSDGDKSNDTTSTKMSRRQLMFCKNAKDFSILEHCIETNVWKNNTEKVRSLKDIHHNSSLVPLKDLDLVNELGTHNELLSTFKQSGVSFMENTNRPAASVEVIKQAEVYSEPVPRKHEENHKSGCNNIAVQPDICNEMAEIVNEDSISIDRPAASLKVIEQADVYIEPVPRKHEENDKSGYNNIAIQPDICNEIAEIVNEDSISIDRPAASLKVIEQADVYIEPVPRKHEENDKSGYNNIAIQPDICNEIAEIVNDDTISIDRPATSFKVIEQAEVYSEPVPRKHKVIDKSYSNCNNIILQPDILDEITVVNEDIISTDVDAEQCPKKESKEINLRNRSRLQKKKTVQYDVSYLDFMTDEDREQRLLDEAFPSEASDQESYSKEGSESDSTSDEEGTRRKKKNKKRKKTVKKAKCSPKNDHDISGLKNKSKATLQKENVDKRNKGDSYVNSKGEIVEAKSLKPNPCIGTECKNGCASISEERRQHLFSYFMNLNSNQRRKDWIAQCAIKSKIMRPRKDTSKRNCTYQYFINEGEGRRKVCQKFLLKTLDITQRFILYTLETMTGGFAKSDERGKNGGHNITKEEVRDHAQQFIRSLPRLPSHYCRGDSKRLYFAADIKNMTNLHRIYSNNCQQNEVKAMSFQVFRKWFHELYNIGFHIPKKDKCTLCSNATLQENKEQTVDDSNLEKENTEYKTNTDEEQKTENAEDELNNKTDSEKKKEDQKAKEKEKLFKHIQEKDASYNRFKYHQNIHSTDKSTICASFDMQKVLNTPHGESMTLYYSRKLAIYNFTIYESSTRNAYCNIWSEADAHRGADEISSCLYQYIKDVDSRGPVKTLLLYCDSCYGQNKNKTVLSMIRYALSKCENLTTIQINYLIPGHTYMPVDSVHATIEKKIKKTIVWAPSQWPTIMEVSRQDPGPYIVYVLKGKDFIGFSDVLKCTFDKDYKIAISKLKIATFQKEKSNVVSIKQSILPNAEAKDVDLLPLTAGVQPKYNLYPTSLGIAPTKYKDLKKLVDKGIIPERFASEYKNLKVNSKVKDQLVETDEEDVIDYVGDE